jgi:hypothetical protein
MTSQFVEVWDYPKIAGFIGLMLMASLMVLWITDVIDLNIIGKTIKELKLPDTVSIPQIQGSVTEPYQKFLDFGLTADEIVFYQNMNCNNFQNVTLADSRFGGIFEQKKLECGL